MKISTLGVALSTINTLIAQLFFINIRYYTFYQINLNKYYPLIIAIILKNKMKINLFDKLTFCALLVWRPSKYG